MSTAFQFETRDDRIGLITFDLPGQKVNTFSRQVLGKLSALVDDLERRRDLRGLVLRSGKSAQFIAGADLKELGELAYASSQQAMEMLETGHALFDRIESLPFPTVALIDGACMGGGTELVLAMDYRIAGAGSATKIALPEVKVGLIPGWGGTQRLPRVAGISAALEMITSGEPVDARKAVEIGLCFDAVPPERLLDEGVRLIDYAQQSGDWNAVRRRKRQPLGLTGDQLNYAFDVAEGAVRQQTKGHYPAPLVALKAMRRGVNLPLDDGLAVEREVATEIFGTPIAANLINIFFQTTRLGRDTGVADASVRPREIRSVGVLGAGVMGAGIAAAHARSGIRTLMVDIDDQRIAAGLKSVRAVVEGRIKAGRATPDDLASMLAMLSTSTSTAAFGEYDLVIEAVTENEQLKKKVYGQLAAVLRPDAILTSNTSTISITRLGGATDRPTNFAGMHFFNPVDRMQLVEVIRGQETDDQTIATLVSLAKRLRKTPIVVKDCPGFLVNRILLPYMSEALLLLRDGSSMDQIDKVAERWGMPMGPIALYDLVGLDVGLFAGQVLIDAYRDRVVEVPLLKDMVAAGRLGKKSGAGFRKFDAKGRAVADPAVEAMVEKHRTAPAAKITDEHIQDRLFLVMLLEAIRAWEERIVREPGDVDMGMILGTGFPAFRGGPLRWCDTEGAAIILDRVENYRKLGPRFEPPELLRDAARNGGSFYPRPKLVAAGA